MSSTKQITDEYMQEMWAKAKSYTLVILKPGPRRHEPGADKIIWEHGRRNHALRAEGILPIVCPVGNAEIAGVGILHTDVDEAHRLMRDDPAVKEGVLVYSVHTCRGFPGDVLPE
jgi:hypothetical protein